MPPDLPRATVISIFKKGDTSKMENYCHIFLLNSLYKVYAASMQRTLAASLDPYVPENVISLQKKTAPHMPSIALEESQRKES